jgi:hypothetical protein
VPCHQELTGRIIGLAIEAHRHRNPGLLELLYATPLCREPRRAGIPARREAGFPAKDVCCASSDDRTPFSVAHRGPCSSSVLKNPWPDTHSSAEWRDSGQSYNDHVPQPANVRPTRARTGVRGDQPIKRRGAVRVP